MHPTSPYEHARELVSDDFRRFEARLDVLLEGQRDYLTSAELAFYKSGKKLRPLLLMLCARAASKAKHERVDDRTVAAAVSVEVIHVGSLIHDDIVDRAPLRRGLPTIHASRGYEMAMLVGDLQFIEASMLFSSFVKAESDVALMRKFLRTGQRVCRGQIDELLSERDSSIDALVNRYYRTIDRKTGQLISFACEAGARLGNGMPSVVGGLRRFGILYGRAFQVMDDVLDIVRPTADGGKESMTDLRMGRLSLPLIYTLASLPPHHFLHRVLTGELCDGDQLAEATRLVQHGSGWVRAYSDARQIIHRARAHLRLLPPNKYVAELEALATHLVDQGFRTSRTKEHA